MLSLECWAFNRHLSVGWHSILKKLGVTEEDQDKVDIWLEHQEMTVFAFDGSLYSLFHC